MRLQEVYDLLEERGLTASQRHFSAEWLERAENYLSYPGRRKLNCLI